MRQWEFGSNEPSVNNSWPDNGRAIEAWRPLLLTGSIRLEHATDFELQERSDHVGGGGHEL